MKSFLEFLFTPPPDQSAATGEESGYVEFSIGGVHRPNRRYYKLNQAGWFDQLGKDKPVPTNSFVGPALRARSNEMGKDNFLASSVVWIDWDNETRPVSVLPPSCLVWSGHGYHLYWKLNKWYDNVKGLEHTMTALEIAMGADACHNVDRIMRLPGTVNAKDPDNPVECKVVELNPGRVYTLKDIHSSTRLGPKVVRKIINGNMQGFKSRSDRDWNIIKLLVSAGLSDGAIEIIFNHHACGDKFRDPKTDGPKYLRHTIDKARASTGAVAVITDGDVTKSRSGIHEGEDGYYVATARGAKRISTFKLAPKLLLEGDGKDFILCDVTAAGTNHTWEDIVFPSTAFATRHSLKRQLSKAAWIWMGRDSDVEALQIHLISQLQAAGMPRTYATHVLGMQRILDDDRLFYVANNGVLSSDGQLWFAGDKSGPIMYVDPEREVPQINLGSKMADKSMLHDLCELLPTLNHPEVIWPLIGWFMITPLKPVIEELGYRFPILNVFGTRGSGKTTTILKVFQPLLGYAEERSYDAKTTRFVTLVLLGSSYSIPIAFSEFRVATVTDFARYILLAYDTGHDPRGRANQTTIDYPLHAPFSIDGEDMVEDSASLERIIAVRMSPTDIAEGTQSCSSFGRIDGLNLSAFITPYLLHVMKGDIPALLDIAEQDIFEVFAEQIPNRIRRNLVVVWTGIHLFSSFMQYCGLYCYPKSGPDVLRGCLNNVFNIKLGRASTEADSFIELVVNAAARGSRSFPFEIDESILWFQLMPAFEYYMSQRTHQRRTTLSRGAIATQLGELVGEYMLSPTIRILKSKKVLAYGVHLDRAYKAGLDTPAMVKRGEYVISVED